MFAYRESQPSDSGRHTDRQMMLVGIAHRGLGRSTQVAAGVLQRGNLPHLPLLEGTHLGFVNSCNGHHAWAKRFLCNSRSEMLRKAVLSTCKPGRFGGAGAPDVPKLIPLAHVPMPITELPDVAAALKLRAWKKMQVSLAPLACTQSD